MLVGNISVGEYTVLDTDNLHFSEEFLEFPARADMDICADVHELFFDIVQKHNLGWDI